MGKTYVGCTSGEDWLGVNGVNRRGAVGAIAMRQALSVLSKSPSPLEVTRSDWVAWRVGIET